MWTTIRKILGSAYSWHPIIEPRQSCLLLIISQCAVSSIINCYVKDSKPERGWNSPNCNMITLWAQFFQTGFWPCGSQPSQTHRGAVKVRKTGRGQHTCIQGKTGCKCRTKQKNTTQNVFHYPVSELDHREMDKKQMGRERVRWGETASRKMILNGFPSTGCPSANVPPGPRLASVTSLKYWFIRWD